MAGKYGEQPATRLFFLSFTRRLALEFCRDRLWMITGALVVTQAKEVCASCQEQNEEHQMKECANHA